MDRTDEKDRYLSDAELGSVPAAHHRRSSGDHSRPDEPMGSTGISEFFLLVLLAMLVVSLTLLAISTVLYCPICRGICSFGLLFSLAAQFILFRLHRTDACIQCTTSEQVCPAHAAGRDTMPARFRVPW